MSLTINVQKALRTAAGALTLLLSLFALIRLYRQDLFTAIPWHALSVFLLPVAVCCLFSLWQQTRIARLLLCLGLGCAAAWIIGLSGVAAALITLLAALSVGDLLGRVGGIDASGLLPALLRLSLGLAALGLLLTVLAHLPVAGSLSYALGLALLLVIGWRGLLREAAAVWHGLAAPADFSTWLGTGLFGGAALLGICYAGLFGLTADTLSLHLYVPSYVATYGSWSYDFHDYVWALEPMASDFLFGVVYSLSDAFGAQLLNACAILVTAGLIYAACRRRLGSFDASLPATAWLCVPYVLYLSASLHAEVLLALFLLAAMLHLESLEQAGSPWRSGFAGGVLIAGALATKVLAVIMGPVLLAYLLWVPGRRHGAAWLWRFMLVVGAVVLLAGGFQYLYAYLMTGNPVFFYYNQLFHSPYFPSTPFHDPRWIGHYDWNLPFEMSFNTQHFAEIGPGGTGLQWFMLVPAALLCMWSREGTRARWYALAALWFAALTLASEQYFRYILPALPFLALLIAEFGSQPERWLSGIYRGGMLLAIGLNLAAIHAMLPGLTDLPLAEDLHQADRAAALQARTPEIAANRLIDSLETRPVNVLYISHSWGAELRGTAYYQSWYNPELEKAFQHLRRPEGLQPLLDERHIDYLVVNPAYRHVQGADLAEDYCRTHCRLVATLGTAELYKLTGPASSPP